MPQEPHYFSGGSSQTKKEFETKGVTPSYAAISAFLKADICKTDEEYDEAKALVLELKGDTLLQDIQVGETTGMDALKIGTAVDYCCVRLK